MQYGRHHDDGTTDGQWRAGETMQASFQWAPTSSRVPCRDCGWVIGVPYQGMYSPVGRFPYCQKPLPDILNWLIAGKGSPVFKTSQFETSGIFYFPDDFVPLANNIE
ncbi:predicted protein [Histoplasma capsulatum var. duboisii H88]|uniref:Predicted protein n=1 Tax=Ajellomyces capsulatus (strain H88) TaxID=544711 RepID=F0UMZ5_AJEC8|nr:predicted protein [Histoplasma capsulatum var. duboisii H88]